MALKGRETLLALVVVLVTWHGARAQSSGCSNAVMGMAPCLNFVTGNLTKPSPSCCSSLTGVIQTQPQCLCTMVNGGGPIAGFAVNQTLALALPAACNVQTPPLSKCNAASTPTASPASAPVGSPTPDSTTPSDNSSNETPDTNKAPATPAQTNTPSSNSGSGSKTVPSTTGTSSSASATTSPLAVAILLLTGSFALRAT